MISSHQSQSPTFRLPDFNPVFSELMLEKLMPFCYRISLFKDDCYWWHDIDEDKNLCFLTGNFKPYNMDFKSVFDLHHLIRQDNVYCKDKSELKIPYEVNEDLVAPSMDDYTTEKIFLRDMYESVKYYRFNSDLPLLSKAMILSACGIVDNLYFISCYTIWKSGVSFNDAFKTYMKSIRLFEGEFYKVK